MSPANGVREYAEQPARRGDERNRGKRRAERRGSARPRELLSVRIAQDAELDDVGTGCAGENLAPHDCLVRTSARALDVQEDVTAAWTERLIELRPIPERIDGWQMNIPRHADHVVGRLVEMEGSFDRIPIRPQLRGHPLADDDVGVGVARTEGAAAQQRDAVQIEEILTD